MYKNTNKVHKSIENSSHHLSISSSSPHYNDVIMGAMASQITSLTIVYSIVPKKTSKLRVTGLRAGNSPGTGEFPAQMASYAENVSIWWRHHDLSYQNGPLLVVSFLLHSTVWHGLGRVGLQGDLWRAPSASATATTSGSALDGAVFDNAQWLLVIHNRYISQFCFEMWPFCLNAWFSMSGIWPQSLDTDMQRLFYSTWPPSFSFHIKKVESDGGHRIKRALYIGIKRLCIWQVYDSLKFSHPFFWLIHYCSWHLTKVAANDLSWKRR